MMIAVANGKGGVGKTNTAIHISTYTSDAVGPTLLIDSDNVEASVNWSARGGNKLPFKVVSHKQQAKAIVEAAYSHYVFDTEAGITEENLRTLAGGCDLLVIPTTPDPTATDGLVYTLRHLARRTASPPSLITAF